MAKKSSGKQTKNLLRVSGILFAFTGIYHILRYQGFEMRVFQWTRLGSLLYGAVILALAIACFLSSRD